jgi:ferredoxin
MRVTVDAGACEANGVCAGLVPEVFDVGDDDVLHISPAGGEIPPGLQGRVREAVRSCPRLALSLAE